MVQQTFTDMEYANRNRATKREAFLDAMDPSSLGKNGWNSLRRSTSRKSVAES